jgi:hypothetical protein
MDFRNELKNIHDRLKSIEAGLIDARKFTARFLASCGRHGIKRVAIQKQDEKVGRAVPFAFGPQGSVFAEGEVNHRQKIWVVCDELGIGGGCGNSGQHSITPEAKARLIDGVYELKNGCWRRVEE